jgi:hypothetical protein
VATGRREERRKGRREEGKDRGKEAKNFLDAPTASIASDRH